MSGTSAKKNSPFSSASEQGRTPMSSTYVSREGRAIRRKSDVAMIDREKEHYDQLRRRISDFVGYTAYEERAKTETKNEDEDGNGNQSKRDNLATNYLKGKKLLTEGAHHRMYQWMGYTSKEEMKEKYGKKPDANDSNTRSRKNSVGSGSSGGKYGGSSLGPSSGKSGGHLERSGAEEGNDTRRRRSRTETAPRRL